MGNEAKPESKESLKNLKRGMKNKSEILNFLDLHSSYSHLPPLKQQLIKQITKNISEILIENFRSLTLIFATLSRSELEMDDSASDFALWLAELNKRIFSFKMSLRKYRMTIMNLCGFNNMGANEFLKAKEKNHFLENEENVFLESLIYLVSEGSCGGLTRAMEDLWDVEDFSKISKEKKMWNLEVNMNKIQGILGFRR